jgi:hypothetical protein
MVPRPWHFFGPEGKPDKREYGPALSVAEIAAVGVPRLPIQGRWCGNCCLPYCDREPDPNGECSAHARLQRMVVAGQERNLNWSRPSTLGRALSSW